MLFPEEAAWVGIMVCTECLRLVGVLYAFSVCGILKPQPCPWITSTPEAGICRQTLTELIDKDCNRNISPPLCYSLEISTYFSVYSGLPRPKVEMVKAFQLWLVPTGVRISGLVILSGKPSTL